MNLRKHLSFILSLTLLVSLIFLNEAFAASVFAEASQSNPNTAENNNENITSDSSDSSISNSEAEEDNDEDDSFTYQTVSPEEVEKFKHESPSSSNFVSGQQNANSYRNEQLNIAFDLPNGFMLYTPSMLAYLMSGDEEDINNVPFDFSFFAQSYEFIAMKDGAFPKLTLVVEKEIKNDLSLDDYVMSYSSALKNLGYQENSSDTSDTLIAGENYRHLSFSIEENSETIIQDFYFRKLNDLLIYFSCSYKSGSEEEKNTLLSSVVTYKDSKEIDPNSLVKDPGSGKEFKSSDSDTLFNPNRLVEENIKKEEKARTVDFKLSDSDSEIKQDLIFARERLLIPVSYLKIQERGLRLADDAAADSKLASHQQSDNLLIKSKKTYPYSIKLSFFNNSDKEMSLKECPVYGIELDARQEYKKLDGDDLASISEIASDEELNENLKKSVNNSIFQAGLSFTAKDEDIKSLFDMFAKTEGTKIKINSDETSTTYSALDNKGNFIQMISLKDKGLVAYKFMNFSLDGQTIPDDIQAIFV